MWIWLKKWCDVENEQLLLFMNLEPSEAQIALEQKKAEIAESWWKNIAPLLFPFELLYKFI